MKTDLIKLTLNDDDIPVLSFTHREKSELLDQKLLGMLVRQINQQGAELHLVKQYTDSENKPLWEYEIRPIQPDLLDKP